MASFYKRIESGPNGASPSSLQHLAIGAIVEKLGHSLIFLFRGGEETFLKALGEYLAQFPPCFSQILREHLIENLTIEAQRPSQPSPGRVDPFVRAAILQWSGLRELRLAAAPLSGDTLGAVGRHCRQLRVLDLKNTHTRCGHLIRLFCTRRRLPSASEHTGNYSTGGNPLCSTLEVLVLSDTLVRSRGVIAALRFCPRLRSLGHCAYLATAVKRLRARQPAIRLSLKHVIFHEDSKLGLKDLLQVCPDIEYLTVLLQEKSFSRIGFSEVPCPPFERITKLMLMHVHHDDVLDALRKLPLLIELQVGSIGVDIFQIGRLCPQLETLHLIHEPRRHIFTNSNQHVKIFQKLQQLKVTCRLTFECASLIFMSASLLRTVYLVRISHLKDHHLHQWLIVNPLFFLESWTLLYAALTQISARLLVQTCPRLSRLGLLSRWDVRSWEYEALSNQLGPCFSLEWTSDGPLDIIVLVRQLEDDSSSQEEI